MSSVFFGRENKVRLSTMNIMQLMIKCHFLKSGVSYFVMYIYRRKDPCFNMAAVSHSQ